MRTTVPLSTAMGGPTPDGRDPPRTLVGALVTAAIAVITLLAVVAPPALLVGLLTASVSGLAVGFLVGVRRSDSAGIRLSLPRSDRCLRR